MTEHRGTRRSTSSFDDHRSRPFHDLLAAGRAPTAPRRVVDLGCGPGHLTALLAARWPDADVTALDSSAGDGRRRPGARVDARAGRRRRLDARARHRRRDHQRGAAVGAEHPQLLPRWLAALPAGAWFALQVPGNFGAPSHALVRELLAEPRWRGGSTCAASDAVPEPAEYAELLAGAGAEVDVWETTYLHRLTGADPVLQWISATALRPVRDALDADDYAAFRAELAPRLRAAYPPRPDGTTWFPFRRIFAVARVPVQATGS